MAATDPWWEIASDIKDAIDGITDAGTVVRGHTYVQEWADFLALFTVQVDGADMVRGWQIVEVQVGDSYSSNLQAFGTTLTIEDTLGFFIRGFTEMGDDKDASQEAFRDLAWEVKRTLDALARFTVTDSGLSVPRSYPTTGLRVVPMLFGGVECWGADMTKRVVLIREETSTGGT